MNANEAKTQQLLCENSLIQDGCVESCPSPVAMMSSSYIVILQVDVGGFPAASNSLITPGKRLVSSMTPCIILNDRNEVALVTGGAGDGSKIITSTVLVGKSWSCGTIVSFCECHRLKSLGSTLTTAQEAHNMLWFLNVWLKPADCGEMAQNTNTQILGRIYVSLLCSFDNGHLPEIFSWIWGVVFFLLYFCDCDS